jgi:tRNA G18 (ribose-2'-O)-methylase SpoU
MKKTSSSTKKTGEIIYGANPVAEALKAKKRKLISVYTTKPLPKAWIRIAPFLPQRPVNTQYVPREK